MHPPSVHIRTQLDQSLQALRSRMLNELDILQQSLAQMDHRSHDAHSRWTRDIYQRLIARRSRMLATLFPRA